MRLLLDTHALLWFYLGDSQLRGLTLMTLRHPFFVTLRCDAKTPIFCGQARFELDGPLALARTSWRQWHDRVDDVAPEFRRACRCDSAHERTRPNSTARFYSGDRLSARGAETTGAWR